MTIQHLIKLNRIYPIQAIKGNSLILGSGRHYRTFNTVTGKIVTRNLITGKFKSEVVR